MGAAACPCDVLASRTVVRTPVTDVVADFRALLKEKLAIGAGKGDVKDGSGSTGKRSEVAVAKGPFWVVAGEEVQLLLAVRSDPDRDNVDLGRCAQCIQGV